jgi:hypothetical protein
MKGLIIVLILATPLAVFCQSSANLRDGEKLLGNINTITSRRTYLVAQGKSVRQEPVLLGKDVFDRQHRIIQRSVYGNGEERTVFDWQADGRYETRVKYYDLLGAEMPAEMSGFVANTGEPAQTDLCSTFTLRKEQGPSSNISIERETCADGNPRRVLTTEYDRSGQIYRSLMQDTKGRSWEFTNKFNTDGSFAGFDFKANTLKTPPYCQSMSYFTLSNDKEGNANKYIVSAVRCSEPIHLIFQYVEERDISYYGD